MVGEPGMTDRFFMYYDKDGRGLDIDHNNHEDAILFAKLWDPEYRRVAQDRVGGVFVSTVFLPIDHSFGGGPPILFETMVFGYGPSGVRRLWMRLTGRRIQEEYQWRYVFEEDARDGHAKVLAAVKSRTLSSETIPYIHIQEAECPPFPPAPAS
jgi:hypothetical protein